MSRETNPQRLVRISEGRIKQGERPIFEILATLFQKQAKKGEVRKLLDTLASWRTCDVCCHLVEPHNCDHPDSPLCDKPVRPDDGCTYWEEMETE